MNELQKKVNCSEKEANMNQLQSFKYVSAEEHLSPKRHIVIHFTDPLQEDQDLKER